MSNEVRVMQGMQVSGYVIGINKRTDCVYGRLLPFMVYKPRTDW
jgi:hypothetical protein